MSCRRDKRSPNDFNIECLIVVENVWLLSHRNNFFFFCEPRRKTLEIGVVCVRRVMRFVVQAPKPTSEKLQDVRDRRLITVVYARSVARSYGKSFRRDRMPMQSGDLASARETDCVQYEQ